MHFQFAVELIHAGNLLRNAVNFIEAAVDLAISLHAVAVIIEQKQHLFLIDAVLDIGLKNFAAVFLVIFLLNGVNFFRAVFDDVLSGNGAFKNRLLRLFQKLSPNSSQSSLYIFLLNSVSLSILLSFGFLP